MQTYTDRGRKFLKLMCFYLYYHIFLAYFRYQFSIMCLIAEFMKLVPQ